MRDKVILVDCDGVLLDWMYAFQQWMKRHGYIMKNPDVYDVGVMYGLERNEKRRLCRMFNESATIRKVPPLRDASSMFVSCMKNKVTCFTRSLL